MQPGAHSEASGAAPNPQSTRFTLIEMLIVMTIIATVSAMGLPRVDFFKVRLLAGTA